VLPFASPEEIRDDVKRTIEIMAPGGGFVFFPSHNIQADVSPDRFHAVFETALQYRNYPIDRD
jgi:uroporphyrinogen decarboxylase